MMEKPAKKLEKAMWETLFELLDDTHDLITQKIKQAKDKPTPAIVPIKIGSEGSERISEK